MSIDGVLSGRILFYTGQLVTNKSLAAWAWPCNFYSAEIYNNRCLYTLFISPYKGPFVYRSCLCVEPHTPWQVGMWEWARPYFLRSHIQQSPLNNNTVHWSRALKTVSAIEIIVAAVFFSLSLYLTLLHYKVSPKPCCSTLFLVLADREAEKIIVNYTSRLLSVMKTSEFRHWPDGRGMILASDKLYENDEYFLVLPNYARISSKRTSEKLLVYYTKAESFLSDWDTRNISKRTLLRGVNTKIVKKSYCIANTDTSYAKFADHIFYYPTSYLYRDI
jgi:hypothetical protein